MIKCIALFENIKTFKYVQDLKEINIQDSIELKSIVVFNLNV